MQRGGTHTHPRNNPNSKSDEEEIWAMVKTALVVARVGLFVGIIAIAEMMEEYSILDLSVSLWSLIVGIPVFLMISILIIMGDKKYSPEDDKKRIETTKQLKARLEESSIKRPIRKRQ